MAAGAEESGSVELAQLAEVLLRVGCPPDRCLEMAAQLDRRARQLAERNGRSHADALLHLVSLMRQGWAAQSRGIGP
jgi:hypothetical protein